MRTLLNFKHFVEELLAQNSRNYKMDVLRHYINDNEIKYYLDFVYNPYIITGISDKKLAKNIPATAYGFESVFELLEYLKIHNTGTDADVAFCHEVLNAVTDDTSKLLKNIIAKNLQLGVDVITINKCMDNFIPQFNVMLANKYFEKPEYVEGKQFTITTKIDGGRIIAIKANNEVTFYTRAGQVYEGLVDLENEMLEKIPDNTCFDGEITLLDKGNLTSKDQYKQTMMITRRDGEKHGVKMLVFDMMTAEQFFNQDCPIAYSERRSSMEQLFAQTQLTYFSMLDNLYTGTDTNEITRILNEKIAAGEEGVMINICDAPYAFKRTNSLLKVKKMSDLDLTIIGYEEGSNSNKGKLGAFIVDYKGNQVKVGSGFSKELREEIWKHPDDYIGLTITVQYFEETKNQNGGISLRFPVFRDFRFDK